MIREGSKRWNTTAVGYFLGKKPYFHHLNEFVRSIWPGVRDVKATSKGFFFFQFETVAALEDVIEGGPWLYLGQPIVLQKWEPGMVLRKLKHTEVLVWIKLRHLPVELWTTEGLSTVASGIGRPLYPEAITRACTRLDFARVCVMLNKTHAHYTGRTEIEDERTCPGCSGPENIHPEIEVERVGKEMLGNGRDKGKDIVLFNVFDLLRETDDDADGSSRGPNKCSPQMIPHVEYSNMECSGPEQEGPPSCRVLSRWRWFVDYAGPGNRIWIAWNHELIDVDILNVGTQFVHCRVPVHELHESIFITVVYGANDVSTRRELWQELIDLDGTIGNVPWLVGGDFNAVLDMSEVSGASGDIRVAMNEFNDCILQTVILSLPMQGQFVRFDNYLALSPGFLASVQSIWRHHVVGTPMYSVTRKLKALKPVFRQQRRSKGDLAMNVKLAAGFLEIAQNILQFDRHNSLLLLLEHCCRLVYLKASKLEQIMLRQRAKLQWLKGFLGGDRNDRAMDLRYLRPWARHILTDEEARAIIRPVTIDEVKTAFFDIEEDKAPGPDGFSSGFFKAAWPVVGGEVSNAIIDFFKTGRLLKQLNATMLTLIPKVRTPNSVADLRPISCCNVIYKVITKILVSRIREILELLISPSQNAFVPGRLFSDNVLLAQELFSGYNQCRLPPRCALKVDLRKAYDTVEWDFLFATLRMFGFPAIFIRWIEECVTSAHYSVIVNGGCMDSLQGHEVSDKETPCPHTFFLVMEVLHMILQQLIEQDGEFQQGLDRFATLSGLNTNPQKSQLIISKAAAGLRDSLLATLGFQEGQLPRIKGWEGVQLSFAGRVQLIKSVLISFEVYWAMAFILSKGIIKEMMKQLRTFLWKGNSASGYPKVAWEAVCRPIEEGGLGIKDILALNRALMSKHLWAVIKQDRTSLWVDWIIRFDFGIVRFGQLRKIKELGVGGKCSHLDII
ncbi:hypothetical protein Sango_3035400 [Sesamum angolense]|uniref:Reverse transcriptase domain-containing protein n=1 Tax=Sesamum angolense TaxID=2727404 RepID=A0AAE1TAU4_9LAMI|nr:hypothetical protein Sango_3035400 [Sesamum angolense]